MALDGDPQLSPVFAPDSEQLSRAHGPDSDLDFAVRVRALLRERLVERAITLIDSRSFGPSPDDPRLILKAELLYEGQAHDRADALFTRLIEAYPLRLQFRTAYARKLLDDGRLLLAWQVLAPVRNSFAEHGKSGALADTVADLLALLIRLEGRPLTAEDDSRILAMKHAILRFRNRRLRPPSAEGLGRLTLMTGGLGPGGAERQLTRLAVELERVRKERGEVGGIALPRPVEVLVRAHSPERQTDFYLADLQDGGVELRQIDQFEPVGAHALGVEDPDLLRLLSHLPPRVNYGVKRLTAHLVESGTDAISVWQDGACLIAGLAALIAGVPCIQLAIRGLPPSVRRHMYRPEYDAFYRAMAEVPGVTFLSNNVAAARAYGEWLDIGLERFAIVYNGVEPMRHTGCGGCHGMWAEFEERTKGFSHTIGGVFRFDTDKQPLTWIRFAARYLKRHPEARFVLVGGGRLLDNAIQLARDLGIDGRILFAGRSTEVGFWMTKMDVLVLLSRYEGLPNVLIEAQYMGVPVVTTPAGGSAECLLDGVSGHVLASAEKPDLDEVVASAHRLASLRPDASMFQEGGRIRAFLDSRFSIDHMLERFVASAIPRASVPMPMPMPDAGRGPDRWEQAA